MEEDNYELSLKVEPRQAPHVVEHATQQTQKTDREKHNISKIFGSAGRQLQEQIRSRRKMRYLGNNPSTLVLNDNSSSMLLDGTESGFASLCYTPYFVPQ